VAPHFDAGSEVKRLPAAPREQDSATESKPATAQAGVDFWLLFKAVGYDEGFQHAHTLKVVRWSQEDTYLIDPTDLPAPQLFRRSDSAT